MASIERQCFREDNWTAAELRKFRRYFNTNIFVAVAGAKIVGYMLVTEAERVLNVMCVGVLPEYRRAGVGRQLIEVATDMLCKRRKRMITHIRESNLEGQLFLRQLGFTVSKLLRGEYKEMDELCIRMTIRKVLEEPDTFEG